MATSLSRATKTVIPKAATFRPDIQGLRALAVVAVILDHFLGWPAGGFIGVDVFFVISGFLITALLLREHEKTGSISFVGFYIRRAKRIMPAALTVIIATVAASFVLFSTSRASATLWDGVWATLFGANWRFAAVGTDYFQAGGPVSPLQHYWSLAVEEQFYFVWPWLMLLIFWMMAKKNAAKKGAHQAIGAAIVVITAASFAWSVWETQTSASWAYFSTFSRAWELGVGAIVAVYASSFHRLGTSTRRVLAWTGLAGIVASIFVMTESSAFPGPSAAFPVLATALLIAAGTGEERSSLLPLTNRVARYLGDISYSLYLWHFPVAILFLSIYPGDSLEYYVLGALAMFVLSVASYHFIEDPIRKAKRSEKPTRRGAPKDNSMNWQMAGLGLLAVVTAATVTVALLPREPAPPTMAAAPIALADSGASKDAKQLCWGAAALDPAADCDRELGTEVRPIAKNLADDTGNSYACFPLEGKDMKSCTYTGGPTRVAVVGDSHAASLIPGLSEQVAAQGWTIDTYVGVGCIWQIGSCKGMEAIQAKLLEQPYDIVITTAYRGTGAEREGQADAFAEAWRPVAAAGSKIIVVEDAPIGVGSAVECVQRINFDIRNNDCKIGAAAAFKVADTAVAAAEAVPNAAVVGTNKYFCIEANCPAVIGNVIVYRDGISHISATYSKTLGPYLAKDIAAAAASLDG